MNVPLLPSSTAPEPNYVPGHDFENAPVDILRVGHSLIFSVEGHYFSKGMFHMLKEYRDWDGLMRGEMRILGRVDLDPKFLDLVTTCDGYLRASSISVQEIKALAPDVQNFLNRQMTEATIIRTREFIHAPSKTRH